MYTPKILSVNLFKKDLNPTNPKLDLEVTMVRPGTDFTLRFDKSLSYDSRLEYRYRSHRRPSPQQDVSTYPTRVPEILFYKSPPPGGTLGKVIQDDEMPIDYHKMNMPLEYTELHILEGCNFFSHLRNLHKLCIEFHRFDSFPDIVNLLGDYNAQHLYHQIKHHIPKVLDQAVELPLLVFEAARRPPSLSKNDSFCGIPEIKKNMPDIIASLFGYGQDVWGFTPNFRVYKVQVLVNLSLWRIIKEQISNIPAQPELPQFKLMSPLFKMPRHLTMDFPWHAAIRVKNRNPHPGYETTPVNKVVGHASVREPTTLLSNSRDLPESHSKLDSSTSLKDTRPSTTIC